MRMFIATTLAAATMIAAMPASTARERPTPEQKLEKLLEGRVAGEPQRCISTNSTQSSQIIDGTAIVYRSGSTLWVNRPRSGAEALDDDDILVTRMIGSQLCSIDTVQLHDRMGHFYRGFVSLGEFVPYRRPAKN